MSHPPLDLHARDFDAYAAEKATSNAYSRPRLELKQRALAWARGVVARLAALGLAVDVHGSDEHPTLRNKKRVDCQWVFFWRDEAARDELDRLLDQGRTISQVIDDPSPFARHAFLALRLDAEGVEVCFAVHPEARVDVDNLRARLDDESGAGASELIAALAALPEEFRVGVRADDRVACNTATPEALRGMLERAAAGQVPLWIGWSVSRETALLHAETLGAQLEDALVALGPLYKLVAWSRDNDRIALDRRLAGVEQARARTHAEVEAQNERWLREQSEARQRSLEQAAARSEEARRRALPRSEEARRPPPPARSEEARRPPAPAAPRRPSLDTLFTFGSARAAAAAASAGDPRATRPPRSEPPPAPGAELAAPAVTVHVHVAAPPVREPRPAAPPSTVIEKGARVRVRSGPFADKVGVIGELDGRGGARVLLGLLSTRLDLGELELSLEGRERPALHSSHRKPLPPAPRKAR